MCKLIITMYRFFLIFVAASSIVAESPYSSIVKRNAFDLTGDVKILPPAPIINVPEFDVFLSGVATLHETKRAYFVLKGRGALNYIALKIGDEQYGVKLLEIFKDSVVIVYNGTKQHLTFKDNSFPTVALKAPSVKSSSSKGDEKRSRSSSKATNARTPTPPSPQPQIVRGPSRKPQIDPRIIEKGLEYLNKTDNDEKREYILKRLESLQSGQSRIKSNIDTNERRRQYDEWKKRNN